MFEVMSSFPPREWRSQPPHAHAPYPQLPRQRPSAGLYVRGGSNEVSVIGSSQNGTLVTATTTPFSTTSEAYALEAVARRRAVMQANGRRVVTQPVSLKRSLSDVDDARAVYGATSSPNALPSVSMLLPKPQRPRTTAMRRPSLQWNTEEAVVVAGASSRPASFPSVHEMSKTHSPFQGTTNWCRSFKGSPTQAGSPSQWTEQDNARLCSSPWIKPEPSNGFELRRKVAMSRTPVFAQTINQRMADEMAFQQRAHDPFVTSTQRSLPATSMPMTALLTEDSPLHSTAVSDQTESSTPTLTRTRRTNSVNSVGSNSDSSQHHSSPRPAKNSRYLREIDRREILSRIERGEKQAALAKEFQVSRAAICNLNKHRDEVLSRVHENPYAKHPKKRRKQLRQDASKAMSSKTKTKLKSTLSTTSSSGSTSPATSSPVREHDVAVVHELKAQGPAAQLLAALYNKETQLDEFQFHTERLVRLLIAEALVIVTTADQQAQSQNDRVMGLDRVVPTCAIAVEPSASSAFGLLSAFRSIAPSQPVGYIEVAATPVADPLWQTPSMQVKNIHIPPQAVHHHRVLLLTSTITTADTPAVLVAIQSILEQAIAEHLITVVAVFVASDALVAIHRKFPRVQIVTTQVVTRMLLSQHDAVMARANAISTRLNHRRGSSPGVTFNHDQSGRLRNRLQESQSLVFSYSHSL